MKRKYTIHILVVIAVLLCLISCEKFFTQYPSNSITENNFYKTEDDFNQAVKGCYARLKTQIGFHVTTIAYRSDECIQTTMGTSDQDKFNFDRFTENASCGIMSDIWNAWYSGIFRCNDVLDHIEGKTFDAVPQYKAEALFIRSWFYFCLYRCFGVVPLTTKVVHPDEAVLVPRCTKEQMLSRLETDLTFCINNLPQQRGTEKARVTVIAAQALLGKVYLTFGEYAKAEAVLADALKDPSFGMMPTTADAFNVQNKMNKEILFAVYYEKTNDNGHGFWWSSSSEREDRTNPTYILRDMYETGDNRRPLISEWRRLDMSDAYNKDRYVLEKWFDNYDLVYTETVGNDFPHLRYADLYLMMAEAVGMQDRIEDALGYLNVTRRRAGLAELTVSQVATKQKFIRELADERGREFALEGHRWFDLVRLGIALEHFKSLNVEYKEGVPPITYKNIQERNLIFPIPHDQIEIVNDPDILWQNPGF